MRGYAWIMSLLVLAVVASLLILHKDRERFYITQDCKSGDPNIISPVLKVEKETKKDSPNGPTICILTFDDGRSKMGSWLSKLAEDNKRNYSRRHGYKLLVERDSLDPERSPPWNKVLYIQKHLMGGCEYILFMDADALVTNPDRTLEDVMGEHMKKDMVFSGDPGPPLNTGIWLVKNTAYSMMLLTRAWGYTAYQGVWGWEQSAMVEIVSKNLHDERSRISVLDQRRTNSFCPDVWRLNKASWDYSRTAWHPGDFIMHFCVLETHEIDAYVRANMGLFIIE